MGKLTSYDQILLAYYVYNFIVENKEEALQQLNYTAQDRLPGFDKTIEKLLDEGWMSNNNENLGITNEGILHIDSILHIQSYATERNKLSYVKDSLLINEIELSSPTLKEYIYKHVGIEN
ncbi:hypothetical protein WAX74_13605 [Psychrobacillus sp. FJAT-51614]|uniref:YjcQ protein n=1 Tax=Psychrobacillus mangrovi TaxID=3117745 RepID=A0ABU8F9F2_9BACI